MSGFCCLQEEQEQQQLLQTHLEDVEEQIRSLQTAPENNRDTNFSKVGNTSDFLQTNVHTLCFCASLS